MSDKEKISVGVIGHVDQSQLSLISALEKHDYVIDRDCEHFYNHGGIKFYDPDPEQYDPDPNNRVNPINYTKTDDMLHKHRIKRKKMKKMRQTSRRG